MIGRVPKWPAGMLFDEIDRDLVESVAWFRSSEGYAYGRMYRDGKAFNAILHRLIAMAPDGLEVDHINGNRLDNRRANLRLVSHALNGQNRVRAQRNSASGILGVHFDKSRGKWLAHASADGAKLHKRFNTQAEAIAARLNWCRENMPGFVEGHPYRG